MIHFKIFLKDVIRSIANVFKGKNICWHFLAYVITYILVIEGFDWWFFGATRGELANILGWSAGLTGFIVPLLIPLVLYIVGRIVGSKNLKDSALGVVKAGMVAIAVIAIYKAFTGRIQPEFLTFVATTDISNQFNFGFMRHGIFWGWPSSHTGTAFAMSTYLTLWYREKKWIGVLVIAYAIFIGVGAAVSFHWFSDVIAGVIIGSLAGFVVYKNN